jgi:hypothetical protein
MQQEWQTFLEQTGAYIVDGCVVHFGNPDGERAQAAAGNVLADLSHYGLIAARGDDTVEFLQGQLTNDVRAVEGNRSQLTGHCTPKGRLLALFRLFRHGDAHLLQLPAELLPPMLKRLRMYVLRSKVVLEDAGDRIARFGLAGPDAQELLHEALDAVPTKPDDALQAEGITVLRIAGATPRYEIYGEPARLQALWQRLSSRARPVGAAVWSLLGIRSGVPQVFAATSEAFVPQMINLHAIEGVSFRKGCYTGQEVVARMQYLGKLKRRMYLAHVEGAVPPRPGDELFSQETESGQGTGKVVDAQPGIEGGFDLLAVIYTAAVESGSPVHLHDANGPLLRFEALPYEVDELGARAQR